MNKISAALQALQQGKALADAVRAKNWQLAFNLLGGFAITLLNVAPMFGLPIPLFLTPDVINTVGALLGGLVNAYFTVATTDKIGLPAPAQEEARF